MRLGRTLNFYRQNLHRHPDCDVYNKCLNKAAKKNWRSFSCMECVLFKKYKKIRKQLLIKYNEILQEGN